MTAVGITTKWVFDDINYFKFLDFKKIEKPNFSIGLCSKNVC